MYRREFDKFGNQTSLCFTVKSIDGDNECEHEIESSVKDIRILMVIMSANMK